MIKLLPNRYLVRMESPEHYYNMIEIPEKYVGKQMIVGRIIGMNLPVEDYDGTRPGRARRALGVDIQMLRRARVIMKPIGSQEIPGAPATDRLFPALVYPDPDHPKHYESSVLAIVPDELSIEPGDLVKRCMFCGPAKPGSPMGMLLVRRQPDPSVNNHVWVCPRCLMTEGGTLYAPAKSQAFASGGFTG